mgnify:CR=1 FL=1
MLPPSRLPFAALLLFVEVDVVVLESLQLLLLGQGISFQFLSLTRFAAGSEEELPHRLRHRFLCIAAYLEFDLFAEGLFAAVVVAVELLFALNFKLELQIMTVANITFSW